MTPLKIQEKIKSLNNAKFGSLSEFVFEYEFKNKTLKRQHFDSADFKWNGSAVDVKGRRKFGNLFITLSAYSGTRYSGIRYIVVDYFQDYVVISEDKDILKKIDYIRTEKIFKKWSDKKPLGTHNVKKDPDQIKLIINKIQKFFSKNNYNARVIYRTTQDAFGKESPDNLLPKKLLKYNVTVFINFKNHIISEDNVKEIFAFRDIDASNLKLIKKPHLHQNKVDLDLIDSKFKFKSICDLIRNWNRRYVL